MKIMNKEKLKKRLEPLHRAYINLRYAYYTRSRRIRVHNALETINKVIDDKVSVARFGDGEFYLMWKTVDSPFQKLNDKLSERLSEVFYSNHPGLIVCVPSYLRSVEDLYPKTQRWAKEWVVRYNASLDATFGKVPGKEFFDTNFTRFYMSHVDKERSKRHIALMKQIWQDRDVCIIEGQSTRFGVGNDLLDNAKSVTRILCPPRNAFDKYDEILNTALERVPQDALVLTALGMTATVLAYDLALKGYQAIDIGHLDVEYEWFLMGATRKTAIKNKAVNEVGIQVVKGELDDSKYTSSIIAQIE